MKKKEIGVLRDNLALDRTHLANERTMLSYWRTAFGFFALSAFLFKFFAQNYILILALISTIIGLLIAIFGTYKFFMRKAAIENDGNDYNRHHKH